LTSNQVSVIASSSIGMSYLSDCMTEVALTLTVILFTIAIFLAGYTLQQQSLRGLQDSLRPNLPPAPRVEPTHLPRLSETLKTSRAFGGKPGSPAHIAYDEYTLASSELDKTISVDWKRLAHVQLVGNHHDVCSSVMLLSELHRLKSPAKRILLFPQAWAMDKGGKKGFVADPYLDTTRRLLKLAARRYGIELRPVSPIPGGDEGDPKAYSLSSLWGLYDYDRVLMMKAPGMVLDATPLDALLAYTPAASLATLSTDTSTAITAADLILAMPSKETHSTLASTLSHDLSSITQQLSSLTLYSDPNKLHLITSISTLHPYAPGEVFNATAWLDNSAYVRFSDPKLPGPEYDVPWPDKVKARPNHKDADWVWTNLYGQFAQQRMDICGLNLEGWYG